MRVRVWVTIKRQAVGNTITQGPVRMFGSSPARYELALARTVELEPSMHGSFKICQAYHGQGQVYHSQVQVYYGQGQA